jgi:hypothetical protein
MKVNEKSRGILATLRAYRQGRKEFKEEQKQLFREKHGPTLGDIAKDVVDTAVVSSYVFYDDTKGKASQFFQKQKDTVKDWSQSVADKVTETKDDVSLNIARFVNNRELRRQVRADRRSKFFASVKEKMSKLTENFTRGRNTAVGAAIIAYDRGREISREFIAKAQTRGSEALESGRNKFADNLINFSERLRTKTEKRETVTEPEVSDVREIIEENPKRVQKSVNKTIRDMRHGDKDQLIAEFATWYDSLDDYSRQNVRDVLSGKREPRDVVAEAQQFRTKFGLDAKVGAIAFFNALKEPLSKDVLSVNDMKQIVSDMDIYAQAEAVIVKANKTMTDIENKYHFLPDVHTAEVLETVEDKVVEDKPVETAKEIVEEKPVETVKEVIEEKPVNEEPAPFAGETVAPFAGETVEPLTQAPFAQAFDDNYYASLSAGAIPEELPVLEDNDFQSLMELEQLAQ